MTVLARCFSRSLMCLLPLALVACAMGRKAEPPASAPAPRPAIVAEPAPVATQPPLLAEALPPARPLAPPAPPAPAAAKKPPVSPPVRDVICRSQRSGKGDDEKTTISCSNNSKTAQTVFLKIHAIGVSGIPTLASEKSGTLLAAGETRTLATLSVISRPSSVNFRFTSKPAP